jgi:hypothetical protein
MGKRAAFPHCWTSRQRRPTWGCAVFLLMAAAPAPLAGAETRLVAIAPTVFFIRDGDGLILRLAETAGRQTRVTVMLPHVAQGRASQRATVHGPARTALFFGGKTPLTRQGGPRECACPLPGPEGDSPL